MAITVKLEGWKETARAMKDLPQNVQRNVTRSAMGRGAKMVAEYARATSAFRDRSGRLRKSIVVYRTRPEPTRVGADVRCDPKVAPHAHLIEFGWQQRTSKGSRHIQGTHFLANALRDNEKEILSHIDSELKKFVQKKLTKLKGI